MGMGRAISSGKALGKFLPNPKLKLREQLAEVCRFRHMSHRTEGAYWSWIRDFLRFHRGKFQVSSGQVSSGAGAAGPEAGAPGGGAGHRSTSVPTSGWRHRRELGADGAGEVQGPRSKVQSGV